jgi:hypothetical protein
MMFLLYGMFHRGQIARFKRNPTNKITGTRFSCPDNAVKLLAAAAAAFCGFAAQAQTVTLGWNASTSVGVTGYRLYWGGASHSYTSNTNAGLLTQTTVPSPAPGVTNYYAVSAYTATGLESVYSTEISYTAPANRPPPSGLTFAADAGSITAPFVVSNHIVYQTSLTSVTSGGQAIYPFTLANAGRYIVTAMVNAPNGGANSFFVNMDAQPTDPLMIWDVPIWNGFTNETVCWTGYAPKVFTLSAGQHQLIIRGREGNAQLQSVTIAPLGATLQLTIMPGRVFLLSGLGQPGYTYAVQTSADLKTWSTLNSAVADAGGAIALVDPTGGAVPKRFYRLKQLSPVGPQIQLAVLPGQIYLLSGTGQPGNTYAVETSSDLKTWSVLNSAIADASGVLALVDPNGGKMPKQFYRLKQTSP